MRNSLTFYLNGKKTVLHKFEPNITLLQYLRTPTIGLNGTKESCGNGICGACTVMMASYDHQAKGIKISAIKSCKFPLIFCHGTAIFTIEGNNTTLNRKLNKVQELFIKHEAGQCGFCLPGMIMSTAALLQKNELEHKGAPSTVDIEEMMSGHTCRCTGYRPQAQALQDIIEEAKKGPLLEPIQFPEELKNPSTETIIIEGDGYNFIVPGSKEEFFAEWKQNPKAHLVGGCTNSSSLLHDYFYLMEEGKQGTEKINILSTRRVSEFRSLTQEGNSLSIGASVCVEELLDKAKEYAKDHKDECSTLTLLARLLPRLRSKQIRTVSTVVGEILAYTEIGALLLSLGISVNVSALQKDGSITESTRNPLNEACSCGCGNSLSADGKKDTPSPYIATSVCPTDCKQNMETPFLVTSISLPLHNHRTETEMAFCDAHLVARRRDNFSPLIISSIFGTLKKSGDNWIFGDTTVCLGDGRGMLDRETRTGDGPAGHSASPAAQGKEAKTEAEMENPSLLRRPKRPICVIHRLPETCAFFTSSERCFNSQTIQDAMVLMRKEVEAVMDGQNYISLAESEYKKACSSFVNAQPIMPTSLLLKRYIICTAPSLLARFASELARDTKIALCSSDDLKAPESSETDNKQCDVPTGIFDFHGDKHTWNLKHEKVDTIIGTSHSNMHLPSHVSGMTKYTSDVQIPPNGLHAALILSTIAHGKILEIDGSEALSIPGVVDIVTAKDIPGINKHTGIFMDTKIFADGEVECVHQPLGLVLATTPEVAEYAAKNKVRVKYEELPPILSMEEGYEKNSFLDTYEGRFVELGDIDGTIAKGKLRMEQRKQRQSKLAKGEALTEEEQQQAKDDEEEGELVVLDGEAKTGGQDHYYGEMQNCVVFPIDDTVEVYSSTQNPSKVQFDVAGALGIPRAKVTCRAMRVGGGFGGKQDRPCIFATAAAVAAYKTGRPVKLILHRSEDMKVHGGRHPMWLKYTAVVQSKKEHKIIGLLLENICQGGYAHDVTGPVLFKTTFQIQGPYTFPNMRSIARAVKTNHNPNTAFRGFGAPQSCAFIELIFEHVADVLGLDPVQLREAHLNKPGEELLTGSLISEKKGEKFIREMWTEIMQTSEYQERAKAVEEFNRTHKNIKHGIAITPMKNGCCFEDDFMNQAEAVVHVLPDGSVEVAHSGIEMGQGLNTKVAQCAAETLGIDMKYVHVFHTCTETCANTQPTAASTGLDMNGGATILACKKIVEQMKPIREKFPEKSWPDLCTTAYFIRTNMSGQAHYVLPKIGWDWNTKQGYTAFYYAFGVSVSEVELDVSTGEYRILRTDLIEDAGRAMNPIIDAGQVEGGFSQGLGWITSEEIEYDLGTGAMLSDMDTYAAPLYRDVPVDLRTTLASGFRCPGNVGESKTTAESPVLLGVSVFMALRHAINAARKDRGLPVLRCQQSPLTVDRIKLAIEGELDKQDSMKYTLEV